MTNPEECDALLEILETRPSRQWLLKPRVRLQVSATAWFVEGLTVPQLLPSFYLASSHATYAAQGGSGGSGIRLFKVLQWPICLLKPCQLLSIPFGGVQTSEELLADVSSSLPGGRAAGHGAAERQRCRSFTTGEPDVAQAYIHNPLLLNVRARIWRQLCHGLLPAREPGQLAHGGSCDLV